MGVYAGPEIVESGLVLALDAGNTKSYPDLLNYYSTPETLTNGRIGTDSGGNYTDFTNGGPNGGRFTRWVRDTALSQSTAWHWSIDYTNTGLSTGQPVIVSFYARCPNGTVSNITLNSPDTIIINGTLDSTWKFFIGTALYGGDYTSTPFVRINRSNTNTFANGATYDIALLKVQKGNIWTDMSGSGNNGTLTNGPTFNSSNGGSIVFDGVDDRVTIPNTIPSLSNFTIELFMQTSLLDGSQDIFFDQFTSLRFEILSNKYRIHLGNGSSWAFTDHVGNTTLSPNTWYHTVWTWNGSTSALYLNGVSDGTRTYSAASSGTGSIILGQFSSNDGYNWNGKIGFVKLYNRALTAAEVQQNYIATKSRFGI